MTMGPSGGKLAEAIHVATSEERSHTGRTLRPDACFSSTHRPQKSFRVNAQLLRTLMPITLPEDRPVRRILKACYAFGCLFPATAGGGVRYHAPQAVPRAYEAEIES